ncbi:MAG TPA: helix-turn-helix domain-containing protein [Candidatus Acidoferrales bacterium]|nr:helix-turn-helix domain-containing protein [Candidatus Acidoferrales bacterium]
MRKSKELAALTWASAPEILTVGEAAALARIPRNAAYEAVRLGIIPSVNFGARRIRVAKVALAKMFAPDVEIPALTAVFSPSET